MVLLMIAFSQLQIASQHVLYTSDIHCICWLW